MATSPNSTHDTSRGLGAGLSQKVKIWLAVLVIGGCVLRMGCALLGSHDGEDETRALSTARLRRADDYAEAARELPTAIKAYRNAGLPWEASDLAASPADDQENAASYLETTFQLLDRFVPTVPKITNGLSDYWPVRIRVRKIAKSPIWPTVSKLLEEASKKQTIDFHRNWANPGSEVYPEVTDFPVLISLLCYKADEEAKARHGDAAARYLNEAWSLANLLWNSRPFEALTSSVNRREEICSEVERCVSLLCPYASHSNSEIADGFVQSGQIPRNGRFLRSMNGVQTVFANSNGFPGAQDSGINVPPTPGHTPSAADALSRFRSALRLTAGRYPLREAVRFLAFFDVAASRHPQLPGETSQDPNSPDYQVSLTPTAIDAIFARKLQFWSSNTAILSRLDTDPAGAAKDLDLAYSTFRNHKTSSYLGLRKTIPSLKDLVDSNESADRKRSAELLLLDSVIQWTKTGLWPAPNAPNQSAGAQVSGFGATCTVTIGTPTNASSMNPFQMRMHLQNRGQATAPNPNAPVVASFPPQPTAEDSAEIQDEQVIATMPRPDLDAAARPIQADFKAYLTAGFPPPLLPGKDTNTSDYPIRLSQVDRQFDEDASKRDNQVGGNLNPQPWLALLAQVQSQIPPAKNLDKPVSFADLLQQSVLDYSTKHFCCINLVHVYGALARREAQLGHGLAAAQHLNQAWATLDALSPDPIPISSVAVSYCVEQVCADLEASAASLFSNRTEFEAFRTGLKCNGNPVSVKAYLLYDLPRTLAQNNAQAERGGPPKSPPDSQKVQDRLAYYNSVEDRASLARELEFWTKNKPCVDRLDEPGGAAIHELYHENQGLNTEYRTSFVQLKAHLNELLNGQTLSFAAAYYLRDAEKYLLDAMSFKLKNGTWPKELKQIEPSAPPDVQSIWKIGTPEGTVIVNGKPQQPNQFEVVAQPGIDSNSTGLPMFAQRTMPFLMSPIVAAYPALKSTP